MSDTLRLTIPTPAELDTNTTPGLSQMRAVIDQLNDCRFLGTFRRFPRSMSGGRFVLAQSGGGINPDGSPYLTGYWVHLLGGHWNTHCVNLCVYEGQTALSVTMVTRGGRAGKRYHAAPVANGTLTPEGVEVVVKYLKSGTTKHLKLCPAFDEIAAKYGTPAAV